MNTTLDNELQEIENLIYEMFNEVINSFNLAINYYLNYSKYEPEFEVDDDKINHYERAIESLCMQLLLREKVYSVDLRKVSGNLKLVEDIERIGDQNYDIIEISQRLKKLNKGNYLIKGVDKLISLVKSMLEETSTSLITSNTSLALKILENDDSIDKMYEDLLLEIIKEDKEKENHEEMSVYNTLIIKYFERIADQLTNIAEWVIFINNGYHKDEQII